MTFVTRPKCQAAFAADHLVLWTNLSRLNGLLVILNISMFFLSGLVTQGYHYTFYSLICLALVRYISLIPTPLLKNLWYYLFSLVLGTLGAYFLIVSIVYWVSHGA